ncbi:MAG: cation diffusion facilitator family transporter, partial [Rhodocyclaceae bacterium]
MTTHDHDHSHHHGSAHTPEQRRRLLMALSLTWGYALVEALAGWQGGSLALLADAGHMVTDGAALGLALLAAWLAARPASKRHSYGFGRAELFAALINALAMLVVVAGIASEAWDRFHTPRPVDGPLVSAVAVMGLMVNLLVAWMLAQGQENLNIRGAFLHVLGDALGSVAAIVAGIVIWTTGWTPIDPLLSLLIGAFVLTASLRLLRDALHGLMDGVPFAIDLEHLGKALAVVPGV